MNNISTQTFGLYLSAPAVFLTVILLFCLHITCYAAEEVEKIVINADHMQHNIDSGYSVYTGNVTITQGDLVLTGEKVTFRQNNENEIEQITVDGKPARYNHITEKGEPIKAESEHMVYNTGMNKLIMTINASLQQPEQQLSSQKIVYDTLKKIIIAGGNGKTSEAGSGSATSADENTGNRQRVNITLTPKKRLLPDENTAE